MECISNTVSNISDLPFPSYRAKYVENVTWVGVCGPHTQVKCLLKGWPKFWGTYKKAY